MATWKGTLLINQGQAGWSESVYLSADTINAAATSMRSLIKLRNNLFGLDPGGETPRVDFFRLSNVTGSRSQLFVNAVDFKPEIFFNAPDMPWTAATSTLISENGSKRQMVVRGLPDDEVAAPFQAPLKGQLRAMVSQYLARLVNSEFRIRVIAKDGVNALKSISNIVANANGTLRVTSTAAHGFTEPGEHAYFYHVVASRLSLTGVHLVVPVTETTFDLPAFNVSQVGFESGEFRIYGVNYEGIVEAIPGRKTKHNTGRPFSLLRGRQHKKRR